MENIDFNKDWSYRPLDGSGEEVKVDLPHDAMITEPRSKKSKGMHNIGWFETGDYLYTKTFFVPEEYANRHLVLEFEGVYHNAEVFLNGTQVAHRPYGYSNFYADLDDHIRYGQDNEIQVKAYNSDQPNSRWYSGTGIYRPVHLYVMEKQHIELNGVKIRTLSLSNRKGDQADARLHISVRSNTAGSVRVEIKKDGETRATAAQETTGELELDLTLEQALLWNVDTPELYECRVSFSSPGQSAEDVVTETFGVRTLAWDDQNGMTINGEHVILKGACIHHDNGVLGAATYEDAEWRRVSILKNTGYNALRMAHNPCSRALLRACDSLGMLIMDEFVDCWYIHKTKYDYVNYLDEWWHQDLFDMVQKDYNHPSVIMYSTGNEVAETAQERGIRLTQDFTDYLHSLDDSRPVSCGINIFFNFLSSMGFGVYSDDKADKEAEEGETAEKKKPVGSEFYNTLAGLLGDKAMKIGATLPPCDWKTKGAYAAMDIAGYNYGIFRYKHDLKKYPHRLILGSETFCKDAYLFYEMAKKEPRIIGDFVWAGMDYLGEAGIGAWEYEDYAPKDADTSGWLTAGSGRIDILGNPNGEALYTQVALEATRIPQIAVKPVYQRKSHSPSAWKMTDAIPYWTYPGCEGYPAVVEVYARAASVELFLNGTSLGKKSLKDTCNVTFKTTYQPGTLEVKAYDEAGTCIGQNAIHTAKDKVFLHLVPEKKQVAPGHLVYVPISYTDEDGILAPMEKHQVKVEVTGGKLLGLGCACSYNPEGYCRDTVKTYYGQALAVVMASEDAQCVEITAKDETGETTAKVAIV
jgi:beta-galactosidase